MHNTVNTPSYYYFTYCRYVLYNIPITYFMLFETSIGYKKTDVFCLKIQNNTIHCAKGVCS